MAPRSDGVRKTRGLAAQPAQSRDNIPSQDLQDQPFGSLYDTGFVPVQSEGHHGSLNEDAYEQSYAPPYQGQQSFSSPYYADQNEEGFTYPDPDILDHPAYLAEQAGVGYHDEIKVIEAPQMTSHQRNLAANYEDTVSSSHEPPPSPDIVDDDYMQGAISDIDSDEENFRRKTDKLDRDIAIFAAAQRRDHSDDESTVPDFGRYGRGRGRKRGRGARGGRARGRGGARGGSKRQPRQAAPLTPLLKYRLNLATTAYMEQRYEDARLECLDMIAMNAEVFEAWMLFATIWKELDRPESAALCLMYAANLRPNDMQTWLHCAQYLIEVTGDLESASYCYTHAIQANPKDCYEARLGKALVLRQQAIHTPTKAAAAVKEYLWILKNAPYDMAVVRLIAEAYLELPIPDPVSAQQHFIRCIEHYWNMAPGGPQPFEWQDVQILAELHAYIGKHSHDSQQRHTNYVDGIRQIKFTSRWLLGRKEESFWENVTIDDREWDVDDTRRSMLPDFEKDRYPTLTYGESLPLELRIKLGIFRLLTGDHAEALKHISHLKPEADGDDDLIHDYAHLYQAVAEGLLATKLYAEALRFWTAIWERTTPNTAECALNLANCYLQLSHNAQAEEAYLSALDIDMENMPAMLGLSKLYRDVFKDDEASLKYLNRYTITRNSKHPDQIVHTTKARKSRQKQDVQSQQQHKQLKPLKPLKPRIGGVAKFTQANNVDLRKQRERQEVEHLHQQYQIMNTAQPFMLAGEETAINVWLEAANYLITDFRSYRQFFPADKALYINAVKATELLRDKGTLAEDDGEDKVAESLLKYFGAKKGAGFRAERKDTLPSNYRGITMPEWLTIFLQSCLLLAKLDRIEECYDIVSAAAHSIVWEAKEDQFLISLCQASCAIMVADEATIIKVARSLALNYQFYTDAYRAFAAMARLVQAPRNWYNCGPTQKFLLRQIKIMDHTILADTREPNEQPKEMAKYSNKDIKTGEYIKNTDLDTSLLMLYGHILGVSESDTSALNYYLRALACDPDNLMIKLSIGIAYIHNGIKRQSNNRQYNFMQGMSFLFQYYAVRSQSPHVEERQEAHYSIARTYHLLGVTHLAARYYEMVLKEVEGDEVSKENLAKESAFNLKIIYWAAGNAQLSRAITERWLTI